MSDRILPKLGTTDAKGEAVNIQRIINEAIGAASVSWSTKPKGTFDSTKAQQIANELTQEVEEYALLHRVDGSSGVPIVVEGLNQFRAGNTDTTQEN